MEYSRGDWKVVTNMDGHKTIVRTGSGFIAVTKVARPKEECEANAHLIASAPKLYEALKALTKEFTKQCEVEANAYKALAEAEGK